MPDSKRVPKTAEQPERFSEAAREAECCEEEAVFDANLKRIGKASPLAKSANKTKPKS